MGEPKFTNLFSTPLLTDKLDLDLTKISKFCYEMKDKDEEGTKISNSGGWHSNDIINETNEEFVKLKTKIEETANIYHKTLGFKKNIHQKLSKIWININPKGGSNDWHTHPHSTFSGSFYIKVNTPIKLRNPFFDINNYYWLRELIMVPNKTNSEVYQFIPEPNNIIMFPPWILHKVVINEEDVDRISISFNTLSHYIKIPKSNEL